jgi:hypothetical protein
MSADKPGRPLGLSLAIVLSAMLYALLPGVLLGYRLYVAERIGRIDSPVEFEGEVFSALASGGSFEVSAAEVVIQGGAILVFLIVALLAWRGGGRPWTRPLFTGTVLAYGGLTAFVTLRDLLAPFDFNEGLSSLDTLSAQGLWSVVVATVLIPLYVLWYVNRAPARAFYRGAYADGAKNG